MNLLLVDDEKLAVEAIQQTIDREQLGFEEVYTAYSMEQAVEVLESHKVSVLISDIEMPKGDGLELVTWIREQGLQLMVIFLTSHEVFGYARTAIDLDAVSYLLKPIKKAELEHALEKAAEQLQIKIQSQRNKKYAEYWNSSQVVLQREFWRKCVEEPGSCTGHTYNRAKKEGILCQETRYYYPILIVWNKKPGVSDYWNGNDISFTIGNIFSEILFQVTEVGNVLTMQENKCIIFYPMKQETDVLVKEKCRHALEYCLGYLKYCTITVYVKDRAELGQLGALVDIMQKEIGQDAVKREGVICLKEEKEAPSYEKPDIGEWARGILGGSGKGTILQIESYLAQLVHKREIDTGILQCIQQDFLQELYIEMGKRGIAANVIFSRDDMMSCFMEAVKSVSGMLGWVRLLEQFFSQYHDGRHRLSATIQEVKQYIEEHAGEDINRNDLAARVYLNPDYLNRMFKEQVGTSVFDYVIQVRMKISRQKLRTTDTTISEVAAYVGYPNTAYFTKIFKRLTGMTPREYRKMREAE